MKMISPKQLGPGSPESPVSGITDSAIIGNAAWIYCSIVKVVPFSMLLCLIRTYILYCPGHQFCTRRKKFHPYFSLVHFLSYALDKPGLRHERIMRCDVSIGRVERI